MSAQHSKQKRPALPWHSRTQRRAPLRQPAQERKGKRRPRLCRIVGSTLLFFFLFFFLDLSCFCCLRAATIDIPARVHSSLYPPAIGLLHFRVIPTRAPAYNSSCSSQPLIYTNPDRFVHRPIAQLTTTTTTTTTATNDQRPPTIGLVDAGL